MNRKDRKRLAQKKIASAVLEINEYVTGALERTNDSKESFRLTDRYIQEQMRKNPQEAQIWERAAYEWREKFEGILRKDGIIK